MEFLPDLFILYITTELIRIRQENVYSLLFFLFSQILQISGNLQFLKKTGESC